MSVNALGSLSGSGSVNHATSELQRAQRKLTSDLAAKAAAAKALAQDRDAVARARQATQIAQAAEAAEQLQNQPVPPPAPTPQQQSKPITASTSALGGSFDVTV